MFFENDADRLLKRFLSGDSLLPGWAPMRDFCKDGACDCDTNEENATAATQGPIVRYYGFVAGMGPDGRPVMYEYGNMDHATTAAAAATTATEGARPSLHAGATTQAEREPLVDTIVDEKTGVVKLIAEMPGAEKRDIKISVEDGGRHVSVWATGSTDAHRKGGDENNNGKKYRMRIPLERKVNPDTAKATYRNGILQISFNLVGGQKSGGKTVRVD